MAKKSSLPNIDALIGNIRPYGDGEAETGKPALILLETIRLDMGQPRLGVAAVMSALPLVIPLVIVLMRKLRTAEVQL